MMCGEMNLCIFKMYELTPRQFQNYCTGFLDSKERSEKQQWEQIRWLGYHSALGNLKKNTKLKDLISFPWENQVDETAKMDPAEMQKHWDESEKLWQKIDQQRGESGS